MSSVHDDSCGDKAEGEASRALVELAQALGKVVELRVEQAAEFCDREIAVLEAANLATKEYLQGELRRLEEQLDNELLIDGIQYKRCHEQSKGRYHSLCGVLQVPRRRYRRVDERNGPTVA